MIKDTPEGRTHFADDATLEQISRLQSEIKQLKAKMAELRTTLHNIEVAANTVIYCYDTRRTKMTDKQREEFAQWHRENYGWYSPSPIYSELIERRFQVWQTAQTAQAAPAAMQPEVVELEKEIKRLQGWVEVLEQPKVWSQAEIEAVKGSGLEYSMYLAEESLLVHRVVEEVQALRRGVGVSYAKGDDPVENLAKKLPPVENVISNLAMIKAAMQKRLVKENQNDN